MDIPKLVLVAALAGLGYQYWTKHHAPDPQQTAATDSANGFVPLPPMDGASSSKAVLIFAPENCPSDGAQRADSLAAGLAREGIPVARLQHVSFTLQDADAADASRITAVMNGEVPIVVVRGRGKPNPSLAEVVAEYEGR